MPTLRPLVSILALLALGACGNGYPKLIPTAEILAPPATAPTPAAEVTETSQTLAERAAALQAQAEEMRTTPVIEPGSIPAPAIPPTEE